MAPIRLLSRKAARAAAAAEAASGHLQSRHRCRVARGDSSSSTTSTNSSRMKGPSVAPASEVIRQGELEKRSDSLFQLWKKKQVVLSKESLSLFSPEAGGGSGGGRARAKELRFGSIQKVDCVERTGKYVYFTIVTTDRKEIDFRCPGESCWNASITMALIDFQNKRAIQDFKSRQEAVEQAAAGSRDRRLARAP